MIQSKAAEAVPRPVKYGVAITVCYALLSVAAFYLLDSIIDRFIYGDFAALVDRIEWETAVPFVIVSSLLFLAVSVWLLNKLLERTAVLHRVEGEWMVAEHRALLGAVSASVLHDCNNMLTVIGGNAALLERHAQSLDAEGRDYLLRLEQGLENLNDLVGLFMRYSASPERTDVYDLSAVARECLELLRHHPGMRHREATAVMLGVMPIEGNLMLIWSALTNLLLNAVDATAPGGRIQVRCHSEEGHMLLQVHDDGPGVPESLRAAIFAPYHSTKPNGHGLGLVSVTRCMEVHGGTVSVTRSHLGGACFTLAFPCHSDD